jgi:prepilin-type N-terminal cleavage/methylation domain-containing protein
MKFRTRPVSTAASAAKRSAEGFTLAEVLAALALMAIVIPVAVHGLSVASLAGEVAQRKAIAARIGERVLNETIVSHQWNQNVQNGTEQAGPYQFRWTLRNDPWNQNGAGTAVVTSGTINATAMHELSVEVFFAAQNQEFSVRLATLVDTTQ